MNNDKIILAKGCTYSSDCAVTGVNNNQIIVGGSGSGKTMSITEPCLLETFQRNLIVTVTKPRIIYQYTPLLESRDYQVEVLNLTNPMASTAAYDPLHFVRNNQDIQFLAKSIVMANPRKAKNTTADPYWDDSAISLMSALISATMLMQPDASFADVLMLFQSLKLDLNKTIVKTSLDGFFKEVELTPGSDYAVTNWENFCQLPVRTASCVYSALGITISNLCDEKLLYMMRLPNKVDFVEAAQRKNVLFVVTSPVNEGLNAFASLFYATAMKELFEYAESRRDGKLPVPTHIICDDFATGAPIPHFDQYISIIREKGLSVSVLCQSESQLENMYGKSAATTIINNCDSYVFTGAMDLATARSVSVRLNQPIEDVLAMPIGQFAVFRRGEKPVVAFRYPILDNRQYQQVLQNYLLDQQKEEEQTAQAVRS